MRKRNPATGATDSTDGPATIKVHPEFAYSLQPQKYGCRVALGGCPPRAPTDPYVLALEHTVPRIMGSLRERRLSGQSVPEEADIASGAD